jgi:3-oxoacyl-[acyl-carrier-protein] synthase III
MYIAASGAHLPTTIPLAPEVVSGHYDATEATRSGMVSHTRSLDGASSLEYAALAARNALDATPPTLAANLRAIYHTFTGHPGGPPAWNAAAKLHELLALDGNVMPFGVTNGCAIGLATVEEACLRLNGDPTHRTGAAVVVGSEAWPPEQIDPLTALPGLVFGDGAAALVITNYAEYGGYASILSTASGAASSLADATRGAESLRYDPDATIDLGARHAYFTRHVMHNSVYRMRRDELRSTVVREALHDADVRLEDISAFVLKHSGTKLLRDGYYRMYPTIETATNTAAIGQRIGHVGTADWFLGFHYLRVEGQLKQDDLVLMTGGGGGWIEAAVVLRVLS